MIKRDMNVHSTAASKSIAAKWNLLEFCQVQELGLERHTQWPTEDDSTENTELSLQTGSVHVWVLAVPCHSTDTDCVVNEIPYRLLRNSDVDEVLRLANDCVIDQDSEFSKRILNHRWKAAPALVVSDDLSSQDAAGLSAARRYGFPPRGRRVSTVKGHRVH